MRETFVTVSGVVATHPRAVVLDGELPVTSFRLASTSRRFDRTQREWVDGQTTWVTVTCWRQLALNANASIVLKDRVVVHGKLRTPEWVKDGVRRSGIEVEAESLGHDLAFGTSRYERTRTVQRVELPGRQEVTDLMDAVELESLGADLSALLEPSDGDDRGLVTLGARVAGRDEDPDDELDELEEDDVEELEVVTR